MWVIPAIFLIAGPSTAIPGLIPRLPPAKEVRIGPAVAWGVKELPPPEPPFDKEWQGEVNGRTVFIRPTDDWPDVEAVEEGGDGSLHITRGRHFLSYSTQTSIYWNGRENVVPGHIDVYRDRQNYIGSVTDHYPGGAPAAAPNAYLVKDGLKTPLGPGRAVAWQKDGLIALTVPVDEDDRPAGYEFVSRYITRLVRKKSQWAVRGFDYLGQMPDSSVLISSGGGDGSEAAGQEYAGEGSLSQDELLSVKNLKVMSRWRLPQHWFAMGVSQSGWVFVRCHSGDELNWNMGLLRGGVLTPIRFARPQGTEASRWGGTTLGKDSVKIETFLGEERRCFCLFAK